MNQLENCNTSMLRELPFYCSADLTMWNFYTKLISNVTYIKVLYNVNLSYGHRKKTYTLDYWHFACKTLC